MIKRLTLLTRKAGTTREQFTRHWLEVHAPLTHAVPGLRRYVQSHIVDEYRRSDIPTTPIEVDGIAELWFEDRAARTTPSPRPRWPRSTPTGRSSSAATRPSWSRRR